MEFSDIAARKFDQRDVSTFCGVRCDQNLDANACSLGERIGEVGDPVSRNFASIGIRKMPVVTSTASAPKSDDIRIRR